jgi:hypothetical protein
MTDASRHGTPRWVKVFAAAAVILVVLVVIVILTGIAGSHGPGRHSTPIAGPAAP